MSTSVSFFFLEYSYIYFLYTIKSPCQFVFHIHIFFIFDFNIIFYVDALYVDFVLYMLRSSQIWVYYIICLFKGKGIWILIKIEWTRRIWYRYIISVIWIVRPKKYAIWFHDLTRLCIAYYAMFMAHIIFPGPTCQKSKLYISYSISCIAARERSATTEIRGVGRE